MSNRDLNESLVGMHPGASAPTASSTSTSTPSSASSSTYDATNHALPARKNIRASFHDYSGGDYFVTICTNEKEHYFGEIKKGEMLFTEIGKYAHEALSTLHTHYSYVEVPLFVVMPNHIHAIVCIREIKRQHSDAPGCIPTIRTALGVVIGGFKQSVTRYARRNNIDFCWQRRYHDHIIRGNNDGNRIAEYIKDNVARWTNDCFYSI